MEATAQEPKLSAEQQESFDGIAGKMDEKRRTELSDTAKKEPGARSEPEAEQYDMYVEEVKKTIPGSESLSAEQLRSLAINLDLGNTKFGGGVVNSLNAARNFGGEGAAQASLPVEEVSAGDTGQLSPLPAGGAGKSQDIER